MSIENIGADEMVAEHLHRIGSISDTPPAEGWTRLAFSSRENEVHAYACEIFRELGLHVSTDQFMNLYGDSETSLEDVGPIVMIGTHLDTVSCGGNFDGVVGFIVAVEAIRQLRNRGVSLPPVRIAVFRAEESTRFKKACLGSRAAFIGLSDDDLSLSFKSNSEDLKTLQQSVNDAGGVGTKLKRPTLASGSLRAYFETHIEQASVLERRIQPDPNIDLDDAMPTLIGVVTSIRAPHRCEWEISGDRTVRLFAKCVLAVESIAMLLDACSLDIVATVGKVEGFISGADKINAVPGRITFPILRSPDQETERRIELICKRRGCSFKIQSTDSGIEFRVKGTTDHSGGTPMGLSNRRDALVAACEVIESLPQELLASTKSLRFYTDVRSNSVPVRDLANALLASTFEQVDSFERSVYGPSSARVELLRTSEMSAPISSLSTALQKQIAECAKELGIEFVELPSGAGHDAMMAAIAGVPTAMMFIPSIKGLSHTPDERSRIKDIAAAVRVQARIIEKMNLSV